MHIMQFRLHSHIPRCAITAACALALSGVATAMPLAGAEPKEWPANPAKHQVHIKRDTTDATAAAMIATAEAALPSKETLRAAAGDADLPTADRLWWYKETWGIPVPCAITADAVAFYQKLVGQYSRQVFKRHVEPSSELIYQAKSAYHPEFKQGATTYQDVHVVTLKLEFRENFAATAGEGLLIRKQRLVIIDPAGKVLHIEGDGPTEVALLAM